MHHLFGLCIGGSSGLPPSQAIGGRPKNRARQARIHCDPLRQPRQLAEGVEFPERYADFRLSGHHLAEGGQITEKNARSLAAALELLPDWGYAVQFILAI